MLDRRKFLVRAAAGSFALVARRVHAQQTVASNMGPMDEDRYKPVNLPAKSATPVMNEDQRNDLEHQIHCQCSCNLDVYTCRTTDFSCPVSPAMHRDVMALVAGGYAANEITAAFRRVYGEKALMAPAREGFNWVGYFLPSVAIAAGAVVLVRYLKGRKMNYVAVQPGTNVVNASDDELQRLRAALRDDS
jgi:cytochrome c-type biogenesis protein CcmH